MITNLFSLEGKTALITGGNGGIGRAVALGFQAAGANVAVTGRSAEKNAAIGVELGPEGFVCSLDVRNEDEVHAAVDQVVQHFGALHILVNNAGNVSLGNALEMSQANWDAVIETHLTGAFLCAQAAGRAMARQGEGGKIINIGSMYSLFGPPNIRLISNAGITATYEFLDVTPEQFDRLYHVNIRSQFFCAQRAIPYMLERGRSYPQRHPEQAWAGGSIVNISSVHAIVGLPGHSIYAGTKGAINAFSRELAVELTTMHIRVNVLDPGSIEVPSYFSGGSGYTRELGDSLVPWGRVGLPVDVGYAAAYMLSDAAEFLTGQVIFLDGGLTAKMALPHQPASGERKTNGSAGA